MTGNRNPIRRAADAERSKAYVRPGRQAAAPRRRGGQASRWRGPARGDGSERGKFPLWLNGRHGRGGQNQTYQETRVLDHPIQATPPRRRRGPAPVLGKTALMEKLCKRLRDELDIAAITNDIYTKEDARILVEAGALPPRRRACNFRLQLCWR